MTIPPKLSVRARLLLLCLGLIVTFGSTNALLGYLVSRNEISQQTQREQYRRFEIIQGTERALLRVRHIGGQINSARLRSDAALDSDLEKEMALAQELLDEQFLALQSFDPASVSIVRAALEDLPPLQKKAMEAMRDGQSAEAAPSIAGAQARLDLIQATLTNASKRERGLAEAQHERARRRAEVATRLAWSVVAAAALIGLLLTFAVIRSILDPLQAVTAALRRVNRGETEVDLPPVARDEFGDMALALRQLRDHAERLRKLAYEDPLTGIQNRLRFDVQLQNAVQKARAQQQPLALFFLDLDNFRAVNDNWGHKAGDRYLCEAVARLLRFIPPGAELSRYVGDSFVFFLEAPGREDASEPRLREVADCALRGLGEPYAFGNQMLHMSVSIGIAVFPQDGDTAEQLLSAADAATCVAKKNGRNNVRFASSQATGSFRRQLAIAGDVRRGLERGEFETFYQPIVDIERGRVVGAEALLRWRHPERGLLLPGEFIQTAEQSGLINRLGEQCLLAAYRQGRRWRADERGFRIAVNLSAHQVYDGKIVDLLKQLTGAETDAAPFLDFELTESALLGAAEKELAVLESIKQMGYRLGLDDFGTGYSSLSYLQRLPIDKVKIDREFTRRLEDSRQATAIVSAVVALARNLSLDVVAEGVETSEQERRLVDTGCVLLQGFLYSPALPVGEFERWCTAFERDIQLTRNGGRPGPTLIRG